MVERYLVALLLTISPALGQQNNIDITQLDPKVYADTQCSGFVMAVAVDNFQKGILSEDRAKTMFRASVQAFMLNALKKGRQHLDSNMAGYDLVLSNSFDEMIAIIQSDSFDWERQGQIDVCLSKILEPLTEVPIDSLKEFGVSISTYFEYVAKQNKVADDRFKFIMEILKQQN